MRLPDGDGLELVEWIQAEGLRTPVAVITAHGNVETAVRALKLGAFDFISKPVDLADLRKLVDSAMRLGAAGEGQARLLGESAAINELRRMIAKVARSQAPVHITGESGTGKELVARMIHEQGSRQDRRVRAGELRRDPGRADGKRILRPSQGRVHRRRRRQAGLVPDGRGRHAVPRRNRRPAAADAGQAAAGHPGKKPAPRGRTPPKCRSTCAS